MCFEQVEGAGHFIVLPVTRAYHLQVQALHVFAIATYHYNALTSNKANVIDRLRNGKREAQKLLGNVSAAFETTRHATAP